MYLLHQLPNYHLENVLDMDVICPFFIKKTNTK